MCFLIISLGVSFSAFSKVDIMVEASILLALNLSVKEKKNNFKNQTQDYILKEVIHNFHLK